MKIAVIGATGLVGSVMLKVIEEEGLLHHEIIPVASSKSVGKLGHRWKQGNSCRFYRRSVKSKTTDRYFFGRIVTIENMGSQVCRSRYLCY